MTGIHISLVLSLLTQPTAERPEAVIGKCDPVDGPRYKWTPEKRKEVRDSVRFTCQWLGASDLICDYMDLIVMRESTAAASVRHHQGKNENGLGPMGLGIRWHRDKWPGKDEDPQFCRPVVSALVAHEIIYRAFTRYGARSLLYIQAVYGGRIVCPRDYETGKVTGGCFLEPNARTRAAVCPRIEAYGHTCREAVSLKDLGRRTKTRDRRALADEIEEAFYEQCEC